MQLLFAQVWRRRRWRLAHDTNNWMALGRPAQSQSRPTRASKWRVGGLAGVTVAVLRFGWSVVDDEKTETKKEWAVPRRSFSISYLILMWRQAYLGTCTKLSAACTVCHVGIGGDPTQA